MTHRLIYVSRSPVGTHADVLATILAKSDARNDLSGITGMLWSSADTFAQVLEGSSEAVAATMGRIEADPRHTDIEVVEDHDIVSRMFGKWAMTRADDSASGIAATSFLVGFCARRKAHGAQRLLNFLVTHAWSKFLSKTSFPHPVPVNASTLVLASPDPSTLPKERGPALGSGGCDAILVVLSFADRSGS